MSGTRGEAMRLILAALTLGVLAPLGHAADLRHFDDAALHDVQFINRTEGWAVGDDGVILNTIDGGKTWERRPTGVRASLRSIQFISASVGWVVGREELAHGAGSVGTVLFT